MSGEEHMMAGAALEGNTLRKSMRYQRHPQKLEREDNIIPVPPPLRFQEPAPTHPNETDLRLLTSGTKAVSLHFLKQLRLWSFVTATTGNSYGPMASCV